MEGVVVAGILGTLCSKEGRERIRSDIEAHGLNRIVVAACSPKEHEATFQKTLQEAGLNPYFLQMANIREQCAWVVDNVEQATEKAKRILRGAVRRVIQHEPLKSASVAVCPDVLILGSGIAGLKAAKALSQKDRRVFLVEKRPAIGGKAVLYEDLFPDLDCASCLMDPLMDEILHDDRIDLILQGDVKEVIGYYGHFVATVRERARYVDTETCIGCGACLAVCPVRVSNEFNEGLDERGAIYIPYAGALPNVAVIDRETCLQFKGQDCRACEPVCPFGSIQFEDRDKDHRIQAGAVIVAIGFDLFDPKKAPQYGYGRIENVHTSLAFERMLNSNGPTGGRIVCESGDSPKSLALVHCVGSRSQAFKSYCSGICCTYLLKHIRQIREKLPESHLVHFYSELCLPGRRSQQLCHDIISGREAQSIRIKRPEAIRITSENDRIRIDYDNPQGESRALMTDMVVLAPAMEGAGDASRLGEILDIPVDGDGFFMESHPVMESVSTPRDGIYIPGCCRKPGDAESAVAQGEAAAGLVLSRLVPGEDLDLEAMVAEIDAEVCSGCRLCIDTCYHKAITEDKERTRISVNPLLCRGCGVCAATCPSAAIKAHGYTDEAISEEIKGLLQ
jgi:heterodisulfide reductase subunit A